MGLGEGFRCDLTEDQNDEGHRADDDREAVDRLDLELPGGQDEVIAKVLEANSNTVILLMGGSPGVRPAKVVVLGAGNVGWNAAWIAAGMEAEVILLDNHEELVEDVINVTLEGLRAAPQP